MTPTEVTGCCCLVGSSSGSQILAIHIQETSNLKRKIKDTIMPELIQEPEAPVSSHNRPQEWCRVATC